MLYKSLLDSYLEIKYLNTLEKYKCGNVGGWVGGK